MDTGTAPDTIRDYRALRETHGVLDLASWGVLRLEGPETRAFLQGLATQDFETGTHARATLFLSEKGRPVALAWVSIAPDGTSASVIADEEGSGALRPHFERFRVMEEVEFAGPEGMPRVVGVAGPDRVATLPALATSLGGLAIEGEPLSFLLLPAAASRPGLPGAVTPDAYEPWRIAVGLPRTAVDINADRIATELSLPGAISLTKGCYVGQEVVARTSNRGQVRRHRVGFRFPWGGEPLPHRTEISVAGSPAGYVTSTAREPGSGDGLGMGFLSTEEAGAAPVHVAQDGRVIPLTVAAWPL